MDATESPARHLAAAIESTGALDAPARIVVRTSRSALGAGTLKDVLSGAWLGHAVHPIMTDLVIGSFTSASLLDLVGGDDDGAAAERLLAIGIAAYGPTALSGVSDWTDREATDPGVRRVGLVHAASNAVALTLYVSSLLARRKGDRGRGKLLALAGAAAMGSGGYLGGHLAYVQGVGVSHEAETAGS